MFDGEDALGQVDTMSLDNHRNLKLAIHEDDTYLKVAEQVAASMNAWAKGFFGHTIIDDWKKQLDVTTKIYRVRGLHLDDRHVRERGGAGFSASLVDLVLYVVNNQKRLQQDGSSIVLYLPKIETAEETTIGPGSRRRRTSGARQCLAEKTALRSSSMARWSHICTGPSPRLGGSAWGW